MTEQKKAGRGRPSKFDPAYVTQGYNYALLGATDEQMATFFEVDVATIYRWKNEHADFCDALKKGKAIADGEVAASLFKRATGYEYASEKLISVPQGDGVSAVERHDTVTHVPADPTSAIFWLKNRQPALWKDKKALEMEDADGETLAFPVVRIGRSQPAEG